METLKAILFLITVVTSIACTVLLFRAYAGSHLRILLWSALSFVGLTVNNLLLFLDLVPLPTSIDLRAFGHGAALVGMLSLLYGFITETD